MFRKSLRDKIADLDRDIIIIDYRIKQLSKDLEKGDEFAEELLTRGSSIEDAHAHLLVLSDTRMKMASELEKLRSERFVRAMPFYSPYSKYIDKPF